MTVLKFDVKGDTDLYGYIEEHCSSDSRHTFSLNNYFLVVTFVCIQQIVNVIKWHFKQSFDCYIFVVSKEFYDIQS